jgi:hypothetical protein
MTMLLWLITSGLQWILSDERTLGWEQRILETAIDWGRNTIAGPRTQQMEGSFSDMLYATQSGDR